MTNPKYRNGSKALYQGIIFTVVNSYWKDYGSPGWFYNLNNPNAQAVPEDETNQGRQKMKITHSKQHDLYVASELGKVIATNRNLDALLDSLDVEDDKSLLR